jgi:nitroreductase
MRKILKPIRSSFQGLLSERLPKYCMKSRTLSSLYYAFFDRSFLRENQAVLAGRVKHITEAKEIKANYFLLVRNTHRIEKGLLMRPRRAVFGKDYIKETIDSFEGVCKLQTDVQANMQLKWFKDVLSEYFALAGNADAFIQQQGERFSKIMATCEPDTAPVEAALKSIPYVRLEEHRSDISFEQFYRLCKQRRSVRWFLDKPVQRDLIDKAVMAANQAPSACNRQPFEFRIFDEIDLVKEGINLPMGTKGYGHSIPIFIVLVGNLDAYFDERDRHVIYIDASLASMSFMLALETMGLSSCAINWPDIETREQKMDRFLKLKPHQRALMCMGVGYPDPEGLVAYSEKRPLDQIRKYNQ